MPGDQQDQLRKTIRALIHQRTGHPVQTHSINGTVYVECPAIYERRAEQGMREAADAIGAVLKGEPPPLLDQDWAISWTAWDVT
ncbi:hypothetical protein [Phytohabitans rumicis]|uniref:Uncharacterized protein n=1 Tax=Phytohabitans rumicis TaxID=1076125 RepID=A0A6V8L834_9ACTN|nr:hypothetical protein [Phytohabitans rumicis]GFJ93422.1 hypothetical protein Prum_070640 [Phytohabitans rumicis]